MTEIQVYHYRWVTAIKMYEWIYENRLDIELEEVELLWRSQMQWRIQRVVDGVLRWRLCVGRSTYDIGPELEEMTYFQ